MVATYNFGSVYTNSQAWFYQTYIDIDIENLFNVEYDKHQT